MSRALVFALLLGPAQDRNDPSGVRELLERLRDDSIDVREKAAEELTGLGKAAIPLLEPEKRAADPELRSRVAAILRAIQLNETLRRFYRAGPRITLTFDRKPVGEVLTELARQSGDSFKFSPADFPEPVTLKLQEVAFWDALHELCRAAPALDYDFEEDSLVFAKKRRPPYPSRRQGEFQVWLDGITFTREFEFSGTPRDSFSLGLNVAWERGIAPAGLEQRLTEVLDDKGNSLLANERMWYYPRLEAPKGRARRDEFRYPLPGGAEGIRKLSRVKGYAVLSFPQSYEDAVMDIAAGSLTTVLAGCSVAVRNLANLKNACAFELLLTYSLGARDAQAERLPVQQIVAIDDQGGEHKVGSSSRRTSYGGQTFSIYESVHVPLPEGRSAVKIRLRVLKETLEKRIPFDFTDLPVE